MLKELIKFANHLDNLGLSKEADYLDRILRKMAKAEEDAMDAVGKEDEDVNNDGKEDEQDEYLLNRREKIQESMEK